MGAGKGSRMGGRMGERGQETAKSCAALQSGVIFPARFRENPGRKAQPLGRRPPRSPPRLESAFSRLSPRLSPGFPPESVDPAAPRRVWGHHARNRRRNRHDVHWSATGTKRMQIRPPHPLNPTHFARSVPSIQSIPPPDDAAFTRPHRPQPSFRKALKQLASPTGFEPVLQP